MTTKNIRVRIFLPGNKKAGRQTLTAPAGKAWNDDGVTSCLKRIADNVEKQFPNEEYKLVTLGVNEFNFVHVGTHQA